MTCLPDDVRQRIETHRAATGKTNTRLLMDAGKGVSSKIGTGDCEVECVSLDSVLNDEPVTFVNVGMISPGPRVSATASRSGKMPVAGV